MNGAGGDFDIVYFSRGRGRGHAVPDLSILEALRRSAPHLSICVCSYGTGLKVFREAREPVIDLELRENCTEWQAVQRIGHFLRSASARMLISHEEFGAIPAANIFGVFSVFLTHWFGPQSISIMQAISEVDQVLFIEAQGHFPEPEYLCGKIRYIGPVLRRFRYFPHQRERLRSELLVQENQKIISCFLGSPSEEYTPVCDLIVNAFEALADRNVRLIWVASEDYESIALRCADKNKITVVKALQEPERLMIASDVVITKGTYNVGRELEAIGVPSIAISHGQNPIDDYYARCIPGNTFLYAQETLPTILAMHLNEVLRRGLGAPCLNAMDGSAAAHLAKCLIELFDSQRGRVTADF